jgi:hypothetical protein
MYHLDFPFGKGKDKCKFLNIMCHSEIRNLKCIIYSLIFQGFFHAIYFLRYAVIYHNIMYAREASEDVTCNKPESCGTVNALAEALLSNSQMKMDFPKSSLGLHCQVVLILVGLIGYAYT